MGENWVRWNFCKSLLTGAGFGHASYLILHLASFKRIFWEGLCCVESLLLLSPWCFCHRLHRLELPEEVTRMQEQETMLDLGSLPLELWILQRGLSKEKTMSRNNNWHKVHSLNYLTPFMLHPRNIKSNIRLMVTYKTASTCRSLLLFLDSKSPRLRPNCFLDQFLSSIGPQVL